MKGIIHHLLILIFATGFLFTSCDEDDGVFDDEDDDMDTVSTDTTDTTNDETGQNVSYTLQSMGNSTTTGTVMFTEMDDGSVRVNLDLSDTTATNVYPAYIYRGSAADPQDVAITLENVESGSSETVITELDDGSAITYADLEMFDGFINVLQSDADSTVILQADIGENALTGESIVYNLDSTGESGKSGTITFHQRENDEILAELMLNSTTSGEIHPAHIHANSAEETGGIVITLNSVDGTTGMSWTHISEFDTTGMITYDQLLGFDGHVNVHLSEEDLETIISQANIGQNADSTSGRTSAGRIQ